MAMTMGFLGFKSNLLVNGTEAWQIGRYDVAVLSLFPWNHRLFSNKKVQITPDFLINHGVMSPSAASCSNS
jgi:hypothetical protein